MLNFLDIFTICIFYRCRRSGDDLLTDDKVKRKKPCTADHVIGSIGVASTSTVITTLTTATVFTTITSTPTIIDAIAAGTTAAATDEQFCVSMSPTEEPVQLSHKRLPVPAAAVTRLTRHPDDLRASMLIDRYVDQICMDDGTFTRSGGPGDRLSIVSPLAKRLADIRLRRSPATSSYVTDVAHKRKRTYSSDDDCPLTTPMAAKRPMSWWWKCSGAASGLTLPDGLPSPFHSSYHHRSQHNQFHLTIPPSPITPLRRDPDDSDDYWKTPVGRPSLLVGVRGDSLLSTMSSKTVDDEMICCSNPRSPTVLDDSYTLKSRRCLSFVSPPPSDKKTKIRRSLKKSTVASVDKGKIFLRFVIPRMVYNINHI